MKNFLLPYPWKYSGILLILLGIVFSILYIWFDFRFSLPVFAVFSSFMETKMFVVFNTNFADELIMLLFVTGFSLIVFSKEKNESQNLDFMRSKALIKALISNNILLLFSILFVYGSGFVAILVINLFSLLVFYLCFFYYQFMKAKDGIKI
jgi:hypothetical protein